MHYGPRGANHRWSAANVWRWVLLSLVLPASWGCSAPPDEAPPLAYYRDAKPILDAKCATCHRSGDSVAPFALETFEQAVAVRAGIVEHVTDGHMPPWSADSECRDYLDDRSLTPAQKKTLVQWARDGVEGNPGDEPPPVQKKRGSNPLSRVDAEPAMSVPYTPSPPSGLFDDQRCFLVDFPVATTSYITGFEVVPGQPKLVHHFFAFSVSPADVTAAEALDAQDEAPGWSCFGGATSGLGFLLPVGAWVPGIQGADLPAGIGSKIEPGGKLIYDIHYNTLFAKPAPDQTKMKVKVDRFAGQMYVLPVVNPSPSKPARTTQRSSSHTIRPSSRSGWDFRSSTRIFTCTSWARAGGSMSRATTAAKSVYSTSRNGIFTGRASTGSGCP